MEIIYRSIFSFPQYLVWYQSQEKDKRPAFPNMPSLSSQTDEGDSSSSPTPPLQNTQNLPFSSFTNLLTVKLTQGNFPLWKAQVSSLLRAQNLFGFVDESLPCPTPSTDTAPNPAHASWLARDQLVMSILMASLTEEVLAQVLDCKSSSQIWSLLHESFAARSSAQAVHARLQLASLKKSDLSVHAYYHRAKHLASSLTSAGHAISDSELITYILAGLGSDYDSIVTALSTQPILPTPNQVLSYLLVHEARLQNQSNPLLPTPPMSANNTQNNSEANFTRSGNRGRGRSSNYNSNSSQGRGNNQNRGYQSPSNPNNRSLSQQGRGRGQPSNFTGQPDNRPTCQVCFKPGHSALSCWHRFDQAYQAPPPPSMQAHHTTSSQWYPDTGATNHYTPDATNLRFDSQTYDGTDCVYLGDGSTIPIVNHGFQDKGGSSSGTR